MLVSGFRSFADFVFLARFEVQAKLRLIFIDTPCNPPLRLTDILGTSGGLARLDRARDFPAVGRTRGCGGFDPGSRRGVAARTGRASFVRAPGP
jgi:hypothetical protein